MSEKQINNPHSSGERGVRAAIRNGASSVETGFPGREPNPRVAEAMAYALKPYIEGEDYRNVGSLRAIEEGKPNELMVFKNPDGTTKGYNKEPGVDFKGMNLGYSSLKANVMRGHEAAGRVQEDAYEKLQKASELEREAARLRASI